MSKNPPDLIRHDFTIHGDVMPLVKAVSVGGYTPSRPLGGWLMTYGKIGPDGGVIPTRDRDGHVMEAAKQLGMINFKPYLTDGLWNDTHIESVIVGVPETLEFHDGTTQLSKSHGKVGFWTTGHLYDRADAESWTRFGSRVPTEQDLERADHFWTLANLLKGMPRPIGFSAHGSMALSMCRKRIIWAEVRQAAVCEMPKNPDSTAEIMIKGSPLRLAGRCGKCSCATGECARETMAKGDTPSMPSQPEYGSSLDNESITGERSVDVLVSLVMRQFFVDQQTAIRWVSKYLTKK